MEKHTIKITPITFYIEDKLSSTPQRFAARFFFDNIQKDFYFSSTLSNAIESWESACEQLKTTHFEKPIVFFSTVPAVFKEFGFTQISK